MALLLQAITLVLPMFLQTAIDVALPSAYAALMVLIPFGVAGLVLIQTCVGWVRQRASLDLAEDLGYQLKVNVFRTMERLPLSWF